MTKTFLLLVWIVLLSLSVPARAAEAVDEEQLKSWWEDLAKGEPEASRALLAFSAHQEQAIAFFKESLKPLVLSEEDLKAALADLGSDDEKVWKPAFEKLSYFDPRLAMELEPLMAEVGDEPARTRLVEVLCDYPAGTLKHKHVQLDIFAKGDGANFRADNSSWWAEMHVANLGKSEGNRKHTWTRAVRAVVLLGHIGTPEAVAILKDMSGGNADAIVTKAAADTLARVEQGK